MDNIGLKAAEPGWWRGCCILKAERFPADLGANFLYPLLKILLYSGEHLSLEMCFMNMGQGSRLDPLFILRGLDSQERKLRENLKRYGDILKSRLAASGFGMTECAVGCPENVFMDSFFDGNRGLAMNKLAFAPHEFINSKGMFYAPGMYSMLTKTPVNWREVLTVLASHPNSFVSVTFSVTDLMPESAKLNECVSVYAGNKRYSDLLNRYMPYKNAVGKPLLHVSFVACGDHIFGTDLVPVITESGLNCYSLGGNAASYMEWAYYAGAEFGNLVDSAAHPTMKNPPQTRWFKRLSHIVSAEPASTVFSLFGKMEGIPGISINRLPSAVPEIPDVLRSADGLEIGICSADHKPIGLPPDLLCRHGMIVGKSGMGKTNFAMGLLNQLNQKGIPFIAIEPVKREYRALKDVIPGLKIYTPGNNSLNPVALNPFLPPKYVTVGEYLPVLSNIFEAAFNLNSPLNILFPRAIKRCYAMNGWRETDTRDSVGPVHFGMREFISVFTDEVRTGVYDERESKPNIIAAGVNRLNSLITEDPVMFDTVEAINYEELLEQPCLIELDALTNNTGRALVLAILLQNLTLAVKHRNGQGEQLKNLIFFDEAHVLLDQQDTRNAEGVPDTAKSNVVMLQNMVRVFRTYGTGLLFADQSVFSLTEGIVDQVNLKLLLGLDAAREKEILAKTVGLDDARVVELGTFAQGECLLCCSALKTPVQVTIPDYRKVLHLRENVPDEEITRCTSYSVPYALCTECGKCSGCDIGTRSLARDVVRMICKESTLWKKVTERASGMQSADVLRTELKMELPGLLEEAAKKFRTKMDDKLRNCVLIQLVMYYMADEATASIPVEELRKMFFG